MIWLDAGQVAERLNVSRKTAMSLMNQMEHSTIGGSVRKRIRGGISAGKGYHAGLCDHFKYFADCTAGDLVKPAGKPDFGNVHDNQFLLV